ncbi:MAG: tyrosine-type recombinase/integrase [Desulfosarcina sp.]|nr:tyrosine-type recombinase/integrase [Desulfobacterales bacterium]
MKRTPPKVMATKLAKVLKKERPDHIYLKKVFAHIRDDLGLRGRVAAPKRMPEILTEEELRNFYSAVWNVSNRNHVVMIKVLFFTGVRNSELANMTLQDVNINELTIRIDEGKGKQDRYVPFPAFFQGELAQYIENQKARRAKYLFETNRQDKFTTRWIRKIIKNYAVEAGIEKKIYPHLLRHQLLTYLTSKGIIDAKIQLISGHRDRKSLEIYQRLSLADVSKEYQRAMNDFPIK